MLRDVHPGDCVLLLSFPFSFTYHHHSRHRFFQPHDWSPSLHSTHPLNVSTLSRQAPPFSTAVSINYDFPPLTMTTGDASRPKAGDSHLCANDQGVANIERLTNSPRLPGDPSDAALCKQRGAATEQPDPLRPALGPLDPLSESSVLVPTVATARSPMVPPMLLLQREDSVPQDPETHLFSCHPRRHSHEQRGPVPNMMDWSPLVPMQESAEASTKRGRRRSSLAVIADRIRSSLSLSRSRSRSQSQTRSRESSISHRLSRTFSRHTDGEDEGRSTIEAEGPYRDVKIAQAEFMARLRAEQESKRVTKNVDGLPIPSPEDRQQRRRSSVGQILGLDKPMLSR